MSTYCTITQFSKSS